MAEGGGADILLSVGIDAAGSYTVIDQGISAIQSHVSDKKIKISLELDTAGANSISQQIAEAIKSVGSSGLPPLEISNIKIGSGAIASFRSQLNSVIQTLNIDKGVSMTFKGENLQEITKVAADVSTSASALAKYQVQMEKFARQQKEMQSMTKSLQKSAGTEEEIAQIDRVIAKYDEWRQKVLEIQNTAKESGNKVVGDEQAAAADKAREAYDQEAKAAKQLIETRREAEREAEAAAKKEQEIARQRERDAENAIKLEMQRNSLTKQSADLMTKMQNAQTNWTKAKFGSTKEEYANISNYIDKLKALDAALQNGEIDNTKYSAGLKEISAAFASSSSVIKGAGEDTLSFFDKIGNLGQKFVSWLGISRIIMEAYRAIRQMVSASIELESAFAQIQIVTGATDAQMAQFATTTTSLAQELGKSVTDMAKTIETFSRLGYNLPDASELAKYAAILSNVANVDLSSATTGLTSIIKGFNLDVSDAAHVADVLTEVGQKYAVSAAEMMEAYEKSGAALNATGTSFEKSAGLIAAANAAVNLCRAA